MFACILFHVESTNLTIIVIQMTLGAPSNPPSCTSVGAELPAGVTFQHTKITPRSRKSEERSGFN